MLIERTEREWSMLRLELMKRKLAFQLAHRSAPRSQILDLQDAINTLIKQLAEPEARRR